MASLEVGWSLSQCGDAEGAVRSNYSTPYPLLLLRISCNILCRLFQIYQGLPLHAQFLQLIHTATMPNISVDLARMFTKTPAFFLVAFFSLVLKV